MKTGKKYSLLSLSTLLFLGTTSFHFSNSENVTSNIDLTVSVSNIRLEQKGNLRIGIFKKEGFPTASKAIYGKIIAVDKSKMEVNFTDIEPNTYGIAVVQDQDKNGKLSTNLVGIPTEPYGFSNNKFGTFGPPDFNEISFKLETGKQKSLSIILK